MSIAHRYRGRELDLGGGLRVRRLLPGHPQRYVGPFVFFDHFGPTEVAAGQNIDVRPHPHIGLATVTYLFDGALVHRDSLGSVQRIAPGDINWMTAGHGIVHSERCTDENRRRSWRLHGLQLWVALPREHEETAPSFHHYPAVSLPEWESGPVRLRLMAGRCGALAAPVAVCSPLAYVDASWIEGGAWTIPAELEERALYPLGGELVVDGTPLAAGELAVLTPGRPVAVHGHAGARAVLIAGAPLDGPRQLWWNFVSSDPARIERAKTAWAEGGFAPVPGEVERIPLPG